MRLQGFMDIFLSENSIDVDSTLELFSKLIATCRIIQNHSFDIVTDYMINCITVCPARMHCEGSAIMLDVR